MKKVHIRVALFVCLFLLFPACKDYKGKVKVENGVTLSWGSLGREGSKFFRSNQLHLLQPPNNTPLIRDENLDCSEGRGRVYTLQLDHSGSESALQEGRVNLLQIPSLYRAKVELINESIRISDSEPGSAGMLQFSVCVQFEDDIDVQFAISVAEGRNRETLGNESNYVYLRIMSPEFGGDYVGTLSTLAQEMNIVPIPMREALLVILEGEIQGSNGNLVMVSDTIELPPYETRINISNRVQSADYSVQLIVRDEDGETYEANQQSIDATREENTLYEGMIIGGESLSANECVTGVDVREVGAIWGKPDPTSNTTFPYIRDFTLPRYIERDVLYHPTLPRVLTEMYEWPSYSTTEGASFGDYDNDGDLDIVFSNTDEGNTDTTSCWYQGQFSQLFERINASSAFPYTLVDPVPGGVNPIGGTRRKSSNPSWADFNGDGLLDLFIARTDGLDSLFRNNGSGSATGRFTLVALPSPGSGDANKSWGGYWGDLDNDLDQDLFVTNLSPGHPDILYRNNGNGTFSRVTSAGDLLTENNRSVSASWGDYDNDGDLDLVVTNEGTGTVVNKLYENKTPAGSSSTIQFDLVSSSTTSSLATIIKFKPGRSNASFWADLDNDGDLDLVVVRDIITSTYIRQKPVIYLNNGTHFSAGLEFLPESEYKAVSWGDADNDGYPDISVASIAAAPSSIILFSVADFGVNNRWIRIQLGGSCTDSAGCAGTPRTNRQAVGARVELNYSVNGQAKTQYREVRSLSGAGGQNSLDLIFGLSKPQIEITSVTVKWPSGLTSTLLPISIDPAGGVDFSTHIGTKNAPAAPLVIVEP